MSRALIIFKYIHSYFLNPVNFMWASQWQTPGGFETMWKDAPLILAGELPADQWSMSKLTWDQSDLPQTKKIQPNLVTLPAQGFMS